VITFGVPNVPSKFQQLFTCDFVLTFKLLQLEKLVLETLVL